MTVQDELDLVISAIFIGLIIFGGIVFSVLDPTPKFNPGDCVIAISNELPGIVLEYNKEGFLTVESLPSHRLHLYKESQLTDLNKKYCKED